MKRIVSIIGSGIGGLAAGCRLALAGHQVTIYEKSGKAGGKASGVEIEGFELDSAPTILRMPHLVEDLFAQAPANIRDRVRLKPLDTHYHIYDHTGRLNFKINRNPTQTIDAIRKISPVDAEMYDDFLLKCQSFYKQSLRIEPQYPQSTIRQWMDAFRQNLPTTLPVHQSIHQFTKHFFSDQLVQSAFSFYPLFSGQNPLEAPEQLAMIHAIEQQWGMAYPVGGIRNLITCMLEFFQYLGGKLVLNLGVQEIRHHAGKVTDLRLADGSLVQTDVVVSNLTPYQTMTLMSGRKGNRLNHQKNFGSSYLILHLITRALPQRDRLHLHSIINPINFSETMQQVFKYKKLPVSPWVYLHIPGLIDRTAIPPENDIVIAISPIPNFNVLPEKNSELTRYRNTIMAAVNRVLPDIEQSILHEKMTTPQSLAESFNLDFGTNHQPVNNPILLERMYFTGESAWRGLGLIGAFGSAEEITGKIGK